MTSADARVGQSVADLIATLVRIPSRDDRDDAEAIVAAVSTWLAAHGVEATVLRNLRRAPVAICGGIRGAHPGRAVLLNATLDTAPFGDRTKWSASPTSGEVRDGWLFGRGSADSKSGIAIFAHLLAETSLVRETMHGQLEFLFDFGEHSGQFRGVKAFLKQRSESQPIDIVYIGYPGNERVVSGCRGFLRAELTVHGIAAHTGARTLRGVNAITRATRLLQALQAVHLPHRESTDFPIAPTVTVTGIHGGESYSIVPDRCVVKVDIRLTPTYTRDEGIALLRDLVHDLDDTRDECPETAIRLLPGWPAYQVPRDHPGLQALCNAASEAFDRPVLPSIAGPSNAGNYFASLGIHALCGFGVTYLGVHALDECIELASIDPVIRAYRSALQTLLPR